MALMDGVDGARASCIELAPILTLMNAVSRFDRKHTHDVHRTRGSHSHDQLWGGLELFHIFIYIYIFTHTHTSSYLQLFAVFAARRRGEDLANPEYHIGQYGFWMIPSVEAHVAHRIHR
jgi:hypothetical protein